MSLRYLTAGESHGPALTAILDGIPAGLPLDTGIINHELARRQKGFGSGRRMKIEKDSINILSGVMAGETTGGPIALLVENSDHIKWKGKFIDPMTAPRPGHADFTGVVKYGYKDLRPSLERASARETTMRVAIGAICKRFLSQFGIAIGGYVRSIGEVEAHLTGDDHVALYEAAEKNDVRCPDTSAVDQMRSLIEHSIELKDTLGGVIEVFALKVPIGLGSFVQMDRRLDARLAQALMSIPAIKGLEIGSAAENTRLPGTKAHDPIQLDGDKIIRPTNRVGGIEGGISNGMPIIIRAAMKPIATTLTPQDTVDLAVGKETQTKYERSDYCPVPRAVPVLEAMVAFVLADGLIEKLGGDSMAEIMPRFRALKQARLGDTSLDNQSIKWWE
jgi:chorismate synthase